MRQSLCPLGCTFPPEINSNDFGGFLELISRFEFEFCRRENYFFLKDSNFWCVHVNVPWPFCAHAIPFRMLWLPRFMMREIYISMKPLWKVVQLVRSTWVLGGERQVEH